MSFTDAGAKIVEGVSAGLYEAGAIIMAQSQILVPVDTGTLKRSGRVEEPVVAADGDSVSLEVGYGYGDEYPGKASQDDPGDEHGYGFWVHERVYSRGGKITVGSNGKARGSVSFKKVYHKSPTQAKYLIVPAKAMEPALGDIIEHNVQARTRT